RGVRGGGGEGGAGGGGGGGGWGAGRGGGGVWGGGWGGPAFSPATSAPPFTDPPSASTLPSGRMTAFMCTRPVDMLGPAVQTGEAAERSMISVEGVAGGPRPRVITRGGSAAWAGGRRGGGRAAP